MNRIAGRSFKQGSQLWEQRFKKKFISEVCSAEHSVCIFSVPLLNIGVTYFAVTFCEMYAVQVGDWEHCFET